MFDQDNHALPMIEFPEDTPLEEGEIPVTTDNISLQRKNSHNVPSLAGISKKKSKILHHKDKFKLAKHSKGIAIIIKKQVCTFWMEGKCKKVSAAMMRKSDSIANVIVFVNIGTGMLILP